MRLNIQSVSTGAAPSLKENRPKSPLTLFYTKLRLWLFPLKLSEGQNNEENWWSNMHANACMNRS